MVTAGFNGIGALAIDPARASMGHHNHTANHRNESPYCKSKNNPCHKPSPIRGVVVCGRDGRRRQWHPAPAREGLPLNSRSSSAVEKLIPSLITVGEPETRQLLVRAPGKLFDEIDAWRRKQPDLPGRAEAVRRLLAKALESEIPKRTKK
jgi:hypothetical protein